MRSVFVAAMLVALAACSQPRPSRAPAPGVRSSAVSSAVVPPSSRSVVYARHGMVAAAHPLAVQIGVDVLARGGSAVDAAIAVNAALGVVEPMSCGIGGDLMAIVWDAKSGKLYGLNGSGRAPLSISAAKVETDAAGNIPLDSASSWTVPGAVDGWYELHQRFGRLPMKDLLAPAIRAAQGGAPIPKVIASEWRTTGKAGYADTFLPAPQEGSIFSNPALARTYELIAEGGRDAYYRGTIADAIVAFSQKHGGFFGKNDFAAHHADWVEPLSTDYRGVTVWELPPSGQGIGVLEMLNILETFDLRAMGRASADYWHTMIETKKLVFEDRAHYIADPSFTKVPVAELLSKDFARARAKLIVRERASDHIAPGLEPGDTTYLATADAEGNMVSLIQSNFQACGSGFAPDGLGFCLQDRGAQFSLKEGTPNFLVPGKRPFHTIIPGFATQKGKPWLAFGVMGGDFQPQGQVQVLVNLVDFAMNLQEAGDAPRFRHVGSTEPVGSMAPMRDGGTVYLEPGVSADIRAELARRGHKLADGTTSYGGYQAILRDPATGTYAGATESRKDGCAQGY
jgi:gamma-glutamyltranspeptidase/glutathione hydrolase